MNFDQLQVILAHHWLVSMRGGEKTLEAISELFPHTPIYSLAGNPESLSESLKRHPFYFSFIQNLPGSPRYFRAYLPFFAKAIEKIHLPPADLLITSDANIIKTLKKPLGSLHLCYCYSPPRYFWLMQDIYLKSINPLIRPLIRKIFNHLKEYDFNAAQKVDSFVAISTTVEERIKKYYNKPVDAVIHPPVDIESCYSSQNRESYYLVVSELTPYKRIDLAVNACAKLKIPLVVIGTGPEMKRLKRLASPSTIFMGWQNDQTVRSFMSRARAFLFPGEEDFGITPVEAIACGTPVIAYCKGGILDTMIEGRTGVFFNEQNLESIIPAIEKFELVIRDFDITEMQTHASRFSKEEFQKKLRHFIKNKLNLND